MKEELLLRKTRFSRPLKVTVLERHESGKFVCVQPPAGKHIWCAPEQLFPLPPEPVKDPEGLTPGERRVLDALAVGPLTTGQIAAVVNGNLEQGVKWTASTAGRLARRLEKLGRVSIVEGKQMVVRIL